MHVDPACPGEVPERPIGTALKAVAGRDVSRGFKSRPLRRGSTVRTELTHGAASEEQAVGRVARLMTMYRLERALVLKTVGVVVVAAGALWLVFAVAVAAGFDPPVWLTGALVAGTAVLPLVITARVRWPSRLLELTPDGYRIWAVGAVGAAVRRVAAGGIGRNGAACVRARPGAAAHRRHPVDLARAVTRPAAR